jgi:cellulose synthase operon protein YhjQ
MDSPNPDSLDERLPAETPEDVAVLYSWANLQGAKYRDFSASRREYRAQMRHRAAEQQREEEMRAKTEAEAAAAEAEGAAREAEEAARFHESAAKKASEQRHSQDFEMEEAAQARAMRHAAELNRVAAAERVEAARRAEAMAAAEAASRREAREMAEAQASAARQAARYAESEYIRRSLTGPQPSAIVPGEISDPYTNDEPVILPGRLFHQPTVHEDDMQPTRLPRSREARLLIPQPDPRDPAHLKDVKEYWVTGSVEEEAKIAAGGAEAIEEAAGKPKSHVSYYYEPDSHEKVAAVEHYAQSAPYTSPQQMEHRESPYTDPAPPHPRVAAFESSARRGSIYGLGGSATVGDSSVMREVVRPAHAQPSGSSGRGATYDSNARARQQQSGVFEAAKPVDPQAGSRSGSRSRARGYQPDEASGVHPGYGGTAFGADSPEPERAVPAWINSSASEISRPEEQRSPVVRRTPAVQGNGASGANGSPVADTLQHSRERVAARWFALKGIFDHHEQERQPEVTVAQQKEVRVPMLTVFSLAGGVGKTSLVATLGRALSSTGEKVLLTDTTSHGLLPFYFGASELRPGVVRTFSPPEGSSDAVISLVSYDVAQNNGDAAAQEWLTEELTRAGRGMQRVVLDLSPISPWVVRKLARMNSVVVVPVAPDMNSVISLGPVEKFFAGMMDGDGRAVRPYYLLNQFDASLPLHLDVREVMRQQLGDRLLPFIIRRSPAVSEALAEGMTVMDYAPDAPVAGDYMNFASWLRMQSAPAATGLKNARWSER